MNAFYAKFCFYAIVFDNYSENKNGTIFYRFQTDNTLEIIIRGHHRFQKVWFTNEKKFQVIPLAITVFKLLFSLKIAERPLVFDKLNPDKKFRSSKFWYQQKADKISHPTFQFHQFPLPIRMLNFASKTKTSPKETVYPWELRLKIIKQIIYNLLTSIAFWMFSSL